MGIKNRNAECLPGRGRNLNSQNDGQQYPAVKERTRAAIASCMVRTASSGDLSLIFTLFASLSPRVNFIVNGHTPYL